jgi:hypothetical protein
MGHIVPDNLKLLVKKGIVKGIELDESQNPCTCDVCKFVKTSHKAIKHKHVTEWAKSFDDEFHSDLWGPAPVRTKGWKKYYISFTNDHTRFTHLYLQKTKDEEGTQAKNLTVISIRKELSTSSPSMTCLTTTVWWNT